ncbi:hypothetical protein Aduo_001186 [Ancylostoma duodenale]
MADQQVSILLSAPVIEEVEADSPIPVRVAETTVLPPSTETFVPCYSEVSDSSPLLLSTQSQQLSERSLMVTPAVFNAGVIRLLVSNPSNKSEVLYKDRKSHQLCGWLRVPQGH